MDAVLNIYKPQGMTPLQTLDALRKEYPEYRNEKMTYAGRLDPMAEGVLIVLVGDRIHKKEAYLGLDKVYEVDVIFGFGTDTHDQLGMPTQYDKGNISEEDIKAEVKKMEGVFEYPFPDYSSKPVGGKPMFQWAREGRLSEVEVPKRVMRVHDVTLLDTYVRTVDEIKNNIEMSILKVQGDFRQEIINDQWGIVLGDIDKKTVLQLTRIRIHCASGTYVRTLVYELGKRLGGGATVVRLIRTKVGEYSIADSMRLE